MHSASRCLVLLAVFVAACTADDPTFTASPEPVEVSAPAVLADLCMAKDAAGELATARTAFARAHGPLHDLARDVQARDRETAARLLEDKQRVESALERSSGPGELTAPLTDLVESSRHALATLGSPAPPCPA